MAITASTKRLPSDTVISTPFNDVVQELLDAMGAYATLKARVDALTQTPSGEWVESGQTPTFVSATQFTIPTDLTAKFEANRRVQAELTAGTLVYSHVTSSSFAAGVTTVNINDSVLTSALSKVWYSFWGVGNDRAYPPLVGSDFPASQAQGDVLIRGASRWERLAAGTSGQVLKTQGAATNPIWGLPGDLAITGQAQGDVLYFNGTNWVRLAVGTSGQFLKTQGAGANPAWADVVGETKRIFLESAFRDTTNPPPEALAGFTPVLDFNPTTNQLIYVVLPIPADMNVTAASKLWVRCTMSTSAAANVVFAGNRVEAKDGESVTGVGTAFTATITPNATAGLRSTHTIVTFTANVFEATDTVTLQLFRDAVNAADTHGGNFRLITVEFEYTTIRGVAL